MMRLMVGGFNRTQSCLLELTHRDVRLGLVEPHVTTLGPE